MECSNNKATSFDYITGALLFIEENITEPIKTEDIAQALFCSKSTIEKLFKYVMNLSIRDYIIRRRMSLAAREIGTVSGEKSMLDLAIKYGYGSNEAFTRAFKSVWHITPSEYKNNPARFELFPAFRLEPELMEDASMKSRKKVDISELYNFIRKNRLLYSCSGHQRSGSNQRNCNRSRRHSNSDGNESFGRGSRRRRCYFQNRRRRVRNYNRLQGTKLCTEACR